MQMAARRIANQRKPHAVYGRKLRLMNPDVTVVTVNFNGGQILGRSMEAVLNSTALVEVYLCDNGSTDDSLAGVRSAYAGDSRLHVIENGRNLGFTRASNIGLRRGSGEFFLLLNPDCIVERDTLKRMLDVMRAQPQVGLAGCLIRNPDGTEQAGCRRSIPTPGRALAEILQLNKISSSYRGFETFLLNRTPLPMSPIYVEAISGAFMMARRAAVEQVGLLDEDYFMHCDDLDWCMRFRQEGWKILFVPDVEVVHDKGTSSRSRPIRVEWHKHRGMLRFYRKFFRKQYPWTLMGLVVIGIWSHFAVLATKYSLRHTGRLLGIVRG